MDDPEIFRRLGLALAIGLLVGLERGWHARAEPAGARVAGIRSFALTGLLGGMSGWLATKLGAVAFGFVFAGFAALVALSYWAGSREEKDFGITTEIAALLVFLLGAAAVLGDMAPPAAAAVVATALLAIKPALHRWIDRIQELELAAAIELAVISVVMLPLLPDRGFGPGGGLNPYQLWWAVVLVAGLSFVGYFAIRIAGPGLGTLITGLLGGLVSSTATTLSFARMARRAEALAPVLAVGTVLAGSVTFLRILALATVFSRPLAAAVAVPMLAMAATGLAGGPGPPLRARAARNHHPRSAAGDQPARARNGAEVRRPAGVRGACHPLLPGLVRHRRRLHGGGAVGDHRRRCRDGLHGPDDRRCPDAGGGRRRRRHRRLGQYRRQGRHRAGRRRSASRAPGDRRLPPGPRRRCRRRLAAVIPVPARVRRQGSESKLGGPLGKDGVEVVWVPSSDLSPRLDGAPVLGGADEVEGEVADGGHVVGAMALAEAGLVVGEGDVER